MARPNSRGRHSAPAASPPGKDAKKEGTRQGQVQKRKEGKGEQGSTKANAVAAGGGAQNDGTGPRRPRRASLVKAEENIRRQSLATGVEDDPSRDARQQRRATPARAKAPKSPADSDYIAEGASADSDDNDFAAPFPKITRNPATKSKRLSVGGLRPRAFEAFTRQQCTCPR